MWIYKTDDKNFPYVIKDSWGGKVYCSLAILKKLKKEIEKIEKKELTNNK